MVLRDFMNLTANRRSGPHIRMTLLDPLSSRFKLVYILVSEYLTVKIFNHQLFYLRGKPAREEFSLHMTSANCVVDFYHPMTRHRAGSRIHRTCFTLTTFHLGLLIVILILRVMSAYFLNCMKRQDAKMAFIASDIASTPDAIRVRPNYSYWDSCSCLGLCVSADVDVFTSPSPSTRTAIRRRPKLKWLGTEVVLLTVAHQGALWF